MKRVHVRMMLQALMWALLMWFVIQSVEKLPGRAEIADFAQAGALPGMAVFALLFLVALVLRALRFGYLIRKAVPIRWSRILIVFPWLFMIGAVTPFRLGDVVRANWVQRHGGSGPHTIGLWLAERATDMLCLVTFGLVGVALTPSADVHRPVLLGLAGIILVGYFSLSFAHRLERRLPWRSLQGVLSGFSYMRVPREHMRILVSSIVIWSVMAAAFWSGLSLALGDVVPLPMVLTCMAFVNLAALISAAPGNIGSFQAAAILALGFFGISAETALLVSSALQAGGLGLTLLAGAVSRMSRFFVPETF